MEGESERRKPAAHSPQDTRFLSVSRAQWPGGRGWSPHTHFPYYGVIEAREIILWTIQGENIFKKNINHVFTAKGSLPVFRFRVAQVGNIPTHILRTTPSSTQRQYKAKQQHLPYNTLTTWSQHCERFWNVLAVACNSFSTLRDKGRAIQYESVVWKLENKLVQWRKWFT